MFLSIIIKLLKQ